MSPRLADPLQVDLPRRCYDLPTRTARAAGFRSQAVASLRMRVSDR